MKTRDFPAGVFLRLAPGTVQPRPKIRPSRTARRTGRWAILVLAPVFLAALHASPAGAEPPTLLVPPQCPRLLANPASGANWPPNAPVSLFGTGVSGSGGTDAGGNLSASFIVDLPAGSVASIVATTVSPAPPAVAAAACIVTDGDAPTATPTPSPPHTPTASPTPTSTATSTPTPTSTATATDTPTATATTAATPTATVPAATLTPTHTDTPVPAPTDTPTPTATQTPTATPTSTPTPTPTATLTPTRTDTPVPAPTETPTHTPTATPTPTDTFTPTPTDTFTPTPTEGAADLTPTPTFTPPAADIAVTKRLVAVIEDRLRPPFRIRNPADGVFAGQDTLVYEATITNRGPGTATNVFFTERVNALDPSQGPLGNIFQVTPFPRRPCFFRDAGTVDCEMGDFPPRFSATIVILVDVLTPGTFTNIVLGEAEEDPLVEGSEGNNKDEVRTVVLPAPVPPTLTPTPTPAAVVSPTVIVLPPASPTRSPPPLLPIDLSIRKILFSRLDDVVAFQLLVTNNHASRTATGVTVTDRLFAGPQTRTTVVGQGAPCTTVVVGVAAAITTCNVGILPPRTTRILTITVNVREPEPIFNVARVDGAQPDPNPRNNVDSLRFDPRGG